MTNYIGSMLPGLMDSAEIATNAMITNMDDTMRALLQHLSLSDLKQINKWLQ